VAFTVQHVEPHVVAYMIKMFTRKRMVLSSQLSTDVPCPFGHDVKYDTSAILWMTFDLARGVVFCTAEVLTLFAQVRVQYATPFLVRRVDSRTRFVAQHIDPSVDQCEKNTTSKWAMQLAVPTVHF
jgi:hypothetical protein